MFWLGYLATGTAISDQYNSITVHTPYGNIYIENAEIEISTQASSCVINVTRVPLPKYEIVSTDKIEPPYRHEPIYCLEYFDWEEDAKGIKFESQWCRTIYKTALRAIPHKRYLSRKQKRLSRLYRINN